MDFEGIKSAEKPVKQNWPLSDAEVNIKNKPEGVKTVWKKFAQKIKRDRYGHYNFANFEFGEDENWRIDGKIIGENEVPLNLKKECFESLNKK